MKCEICERRIQEIKSWGEDPKNCKYKCLKCLENASVNNCVNWVVEFTFTNLFEKKESDLLQDLEYYLEEKLNIKMYSTNYDNDNFTVELYNFKDLDLLINDLYKKCGYEIKMFFYVDQDIKNELNTELKSFIGFLEKELIDYDQDNYKYILIEDLTYRKSLQINQFIESLKK